MERCKGVQSIVTITKKYFKEAVAKKLQSIHQQ